VNAGHVESYGPILGYGPQDTHSEQTIVDYWNKRRIPLLRLKSGEHLNLLIFTRNTMCIPCRKKIPTWMEELALAVGSGVTIHLYLWQSVNSRSLVDLRNLEQVPLGI
jgi:hypothetical protein